MKKICEILNLDWFEIIADKWKEIPSVYKKSFLIIFIGINIAFAFHTFSFFHGYLDWGRSMKGININEALFAGRFSMHYVDWVLKGNNILPILGNMYLFLIVS
ncbi:MAG: hypothetical protein LBN20_05615, partial [Endomicrobium sp.]|nr:hypothetical protein [Endomicrobium sp.]